MVVVMVVVVVVMLEDDGEATIGGVDRHMMVAVRHQMKGGEPGAAASHEGHQKQDRYGRCETAHPLRNYRAPATASRRDPRRVVAAAARQRPLGDRDANAKSCVLPT